MNDQRFSALVVDDEPALRRLTVSVLSRFNFSCDEARDGDEAGNLVSRRKYDVVVTDLRMPKRNGHALAVELLSAGGERPLIVVLTGVLEPRLAEDLIARGVDEVEFKPVNFALFGAKIRARCEHRARQQMKPVAPAGANTQGQPPAEDVANCSRVTARQLEQRLEALAGALPVSPAAIEVVNLAHERSPDLDAIAQCIARDPGFSVELLKIANSSYYNPSGQLADDLQSAILRLGHRKIGELALASATLQTLAKSVLTWVDADTVWRRCLATGQAIEYLCSTAKLAGDDEGLLISAMLVPMGRVLVGMAYPELYKQMVGRSQETGASLASLEREVFETSPEMAVSMYLARAGLSPRLYKPLKHAATPYTEIAKLTEPLRTKVERLRIASVLGGMVVGRYLPWDEIDLPPSAMIRRMGIDQISSLISRLREDLARLAPQDASGHSSQVASGTGASGSESAEIRYFKLTVEPNELLAAFAEALGMKLVPVSRKAACTTEPVLVNCFDVSDERLAEFLGEAQPNLTRVFVGNGAGRPSSAPRGSFVTMPCGFGSLAKQLRAAAIHHPRPSGGEPRKM